MELLHKKSGSTASLKEFRRKVKMIVESHVLPDYRLRYQPQADQVLFYTKDPKRLAASFGPSNTDYRSIGHQSVGPSDTDASVYQTPGAKNSAGISSAFPTYPHPVIGARELNNLSNVLTPNPSPE